MHGVQRHQHVGAPLQGHTHAAFGTDALPHQPMGQAVGAGIELGEGQAVVAVDNGYGVRALARLFGDQGRDRTRVHCRVLHAVPLGPDLLFAVRQQRQVRQVGHGLTTDHLQQGLQLFGHSRHRRRVEDIRREVQVTVDSTVRVFVGAQYQIEMRVLRRTGERLAAQLMQVRQGLLVKDLMVVAGLEQRIVAQTSLRLQCFHQLLKWQIRMRLGSVHSLSYLGQKITDPVTGINLGTHHQRIDEEANQSLGARLMPSRNRNTHAQIPLTTESVQQRFKAGQNDHKQRNFLITGRATQPLRQRRWQSEGVSGTTAIPLPRTRAVRGQLKNRMFITQLPSPPLQLPIQLSTRQLLSLPKCVVRILNVQRCQPIGLTS